MIAYISAIQEEPVDADEILTSVRNFIQVCEHDRVHSLRHFEHVRNRNPDKADSLRGELLQHLKDLNKVVNESMSLLNYLPNIAQQFGLEGPIGGAILKPRLQVPSENSHSHSEAEDVLNNAENKFYKHKPADEDDIDDDDDDDDDYDDDDDDDDYYDEDEDDYDEDFDDDDEDDDEDIAVDATEAPSVVDETPIVVKTTSKSSKNKVPVEPKPVSKQVDVKDENEYPAPLDVTDHIDKDSLDVDAKPIKEVDVPKDIEVDDGETLAQLDGDIKAIKSEIEASQRSPFAFTVIMGLSGGVLVIMLFIIIAMVMRRRRFNQSRLIVTENNDEHDHLVQMQRNGFENPTYKFFYY
jgi:hypothetical protein